MKQVITNYTFDASAQTITFNDYTAIALERLTLITNLTDGIVIYQFNSATKGGTVTGNVLTLTYDTTAMADADDLQIFYEVDTALTPSGAQIIGTASDRFFENFADYDTVNTWEEVQVGTGMSITGPLGGAAAGSSPYLNIASGTTINQKTILLSRATFSAPFDLRYQITANQRIANNRFIIGFVQVDDSGAILTSTSITTAPDVLDARNAVVHQHDGTTATTAQLRVRAAGSALDTFANAFGTGFTTVATGSSPNFLTATTYGLTFEREKINARAYGANVITNTGGQFGYDRTMPNPTGKYKLVIIVENLGTAPASSTDWRIHLVNVMDAVRLDVSPRNPGGSDASKSFPVNVTAMPSHAVTLTSTTVASVIPFAVADVASAAITTTTTTATITPTAGTSYQVVIPVTAVSGTTPTLSVRIEESDDAGTNWYERYTFPTITTTGIYRSPILRLRGNRVRYVQTVTGTTPSFTRAISRLYRSDAFNSGRPGKLVSAASTNATLVLGAPCEVTKLTVSNTNAAARYLKIYDTATAPTVGTDVPVATYLIPGATTGTGSNIPITIPDSFQLGFGLALTTGVADSDTGAVAANEIVVNYSIA